MTKFEKWWEENADEFEQASYKCAAKMAFDAGVELGGCTHENFTNASLRSWCHDCNSWF